LQRHPDVVRIVLSDAGEQDLVRSAATAHQYLVRSCNVYLGVDTIRALTLSTRVFSAPQASGLAQNLIGQLQHHSTVTGLVASAIGKAEKLPKKVCDGGMVGGLLHDVWKLVLAANCPQEYDVVLNTVKK
jgi:hypothetical protein